MYNITFVYSLLHTNANANLLHYSGHHDDGVEVMLFNYEKPKLSAVNREARFFSTGGERFPPFPKNGKHLSVTNVVTITNALSVHPCQTCFSKLLKTII